MRRYRWQSPSVKLISMALWGSIAALTGNMMSNLLLHTPDGLLQWGCMPVLQAGGVGRHPRHRRTMQPW